MLRVEVHIPSNEAELPDVNLTLIWIHVAMQLVRPSFLSGRTETSKLRPWTVILIAIGAATGPLRYRRSRDPFRSVNQRYALPGRSEPVTR